ncbi:MAG: sensor histidine kinase [Planctomycetota bacterium]|jgi:two-component system phosphate regulon sensor histidine kinase PhoR
MAAVAACAKAGPGYAVTGAFVSLTALACLVFYCVQIITSANRIVDMLESTKPGHIMTKTPLFMDPLADAIERFADRYSKKVDELETQNSNISLQKQLLEKQKQNIEEIIYSIRDAVIVTDAFDRLVLANNAARQLFAFNVPPAGTQQIEEIIGHEEFIQLIVRSRRSKLRHVKHELTIEADGQTKIFDCIISCVQDDQDVTSGVVAILHDMTREKETSQMKNDFVSHVSHELKTPLASINAYAEMLVDGEAQDTKTLNDFCSVIQSQAQRLARLIEDILNISRIESGITKIKKEHLSVAILMAEAVKMIDSYAREKNISVDVQAAIICDQVYADKDMITQVIINLLSNAVKYTPQGGSVEVGIDVDEADRTVRLSVSDTGVGIPENDLEYVFDKFYRVEANNKCAKGTGLGLNLVKQIVEKVHGGKVFVTSTPGRGSTFGFDLPLATGVTCETVLEK